MRSISLLNRPVLVYMSLLNVFRVMGLPIRMPIMMADDEDNFKDIY